MIHARFQSTDACAISDSPTRETGICRCSSAASALEPDRSVVETVILLAPSRSLATPGGSARGGHLLVAPDSRWRSLPSGEERQSVMINTSERLARGARSMIAKSVRRAA